MMTAAARNSSRDSSVNSSRTSSRSPDLGPGVMAVDQQPAVHAALLRAGDPDRRRDLADWATRVCGVATSMLAASGATVTATSDGSRHLVAASDFNARALDDAQGTLGQGPGIDVANHFRLVLEPDLAAAGPARWSAFTKHAVARGVRAVFAFPLHVGAARLGVLAVYRQTPGALTPQERWIASALAESATDALIDAAEAPAALEPTDLAGGFAAQQALYQAQGMVMIDLATTLTEAIARLRRHAAEHHEKPSDVARQIVDGTLRLARI